MISSFNDSIGNIPGVPELEIPEIEKLEAPQIPLIPNPPEQKAPPENKEGQQVPTLEGGGINLNLSGIGGGSVTSRSGQKISGAFGLTHSW